jgi:hypothetical protein
MAKEDHEKTLPTMLAKPLRRLPTSTAHGRIHKESLKTADFQTWKNSLKDFPGEAESKKCGLPAPANRRRCAAHGKKHRAAEPPRV